MARTTGIPTACLVSAAVFLSQGVVRADSNSVFRLGPLRVVPLETASAEPRFLASFRSLLEGEGLAPPGFRLGLQFPPSPSRIQPEEILGPALPDERNHRKPRIGWVVASSIGAVAGSAFNSFTDKPKASHYHFTNEGFFGQNTYAGGADKASHFVSFNHVSHILTAVNEAAGLRAEDAAIVGSAVAELTGLMIEIGDGTTHYGFSYEDLVMDTLGAATALGTMHYGLEDLIGFRVGFVRGPNGRYAGSDYSTLIYTGDLKIAGLARRWQFHPGPARFLLLSATYASKGYSDLGQETHQRQIGLEVGLHFTEVLRAIGIPEHRWWSKGLYMLFDIVRIPYTAWGFRYDLNHGRWHGPDTGDTFEDPTAVRAVFSTGVSRR